FMCGVVEGFYGRPWTAEQRIELFRRMSVMGLNTYLYAPKDDYKHRLFWREKYSDDESALLRTLIEEAEAHNVLFVYAISPGLDISFASEAEVTLLKNKLLQVQGLGCKAFALLFDDIDPVLCASDSEKFQSSANAQASITNIIYDVLDNPRFLFCPTEYCSNMAIPDVGCSPYLKTIGEKLNPNISIMWTGPKVVSHVISLESIKILNKILKRKVVIWDNIHANDYDPKRVFLGPFKGRSTHLIPHLGGVMTNPNCEFEANYIAMHSLATWWKSLDQSKDSDSISSGRATDSDSDSDYSSYDGRFFPPIHNFNHGEYNPDTALQQALTAWLPIFSQSKYPNRKVVPRSGTPPAMPMLPNHSIISQSPIPAVCTTKAVTKAVVSVKEDLNLAQSTINSELLERTLEKPPEPKKSAISVTYATRGQKARDLESEERLPGKPDVDMEENESKSEEMQTEGDANKTKPDQMDTEEMSEPLDAMQTDGEDSDVSMATANSSAPVTDVEEMSSSPGGADEKKNDESAEKAEKKISEDDYNPMKSDELENQTISFKDLLLLTECFYLPYEHGHTGKTMVQKFRWLKEKAVKLSESKNKNSEEYLDKTSLDPQALEWSEKALLFEGQCKGVNAVFNRICACPNRALLYELFPYLWDLKGMVTMLSSYVKWLGEFNPVLSSPSGPPHTYNWLGPDPEPWVFRGGLSGEFQRLLPISSSYDLFCQALPHTPQTSTYIVRPYLPSDESSVFDVCSSTWKDGVESSHSFENLKQLPADRLIGALLTLSPEYCFVVEDNEGVCGYLAATHNAKDFWRKYEIAYLPEMREKYSKPEAEDEMTEAEFTNSPPQKMIVDLHSTGDRYSYGSDLLASSHPAMMTLALTQTANPSVAKSMTVCLLSALKSHNASGIHVIVDSNSKHFQDLYLKLGFTKIPDLDTSEDITILGRVF
uniref:protein O-GlcNAcase n=1 Tax=Ciona savignyi TaxID=51511 RepID=H2Z2S4_CIOSA